MDLAAIEWYHRLRNQLYHQGYGLTVDRRKVEIYAEVANILFKNLFGESPLIKRPATELLGRFIELWLMLESALHGIAWDNSLTGIRRGSPASTMSYLRSGGLLPDDELDEIQKMLRLRNEIIHGAVDYKTALTEEIVDKLQALVNSMREDGFLS